MWKCEQPRGSCVWSSESEWCTASRRESNLCARSQTRLKANVTAMQASHTLSDPPAPVLVPCSHTCEVWTAGSSMMRITCSGSSCSSLTSRPTSTYGQ